MKIKKNIPLFIAIGFIVLAVLLNLSYIGGFFNDLEFMIARLSGEYDYYPILYVVCEAIKSLFYLFIELCLIGLILVLLFLPEHKSFRFLLSLILFLLSICFFISAVARMYGTIELEYFEPFVSISIIRSLIEFLLSLLFLPLAITTISKATKLKVFNILNIVTICSIGALVFIFEVVLIVVKIVNDYPTILEKLTFFNFSLIFGLGFYFISNSITKKS